MKWCHCLNRSRRLLIMLGMIVSFCVVELVVGHLVGSLSLVADSFHMLSDAVSLVVAAVAIRASKSRNKERNTFGWVRAEVLGALINGVFLLALCFTIVVHSLERFLERHHIENPRRVLIVGLIGLGINVLGLFLFHDHAGHSHGGHVELAQTSSIDSAECEEVCADEKCDTCFETPTRIGKQGDIEFEAELPKNGLYHNSNHSSEDAGQDTPTSSATEETTVDPFLVIPTVIETPHLSKSHHHHEHGNMRAVFLHVACDALGSILVILSALLYMGMDKYGDDLDIHSREWLAFVDPTISVIIVLAVSVPTFNLVKNSAEVLLNNVPRGVSPREIASDLIHEIPGIEAIQDFHIWRLTSGVNCGSIHVLIDESLTIDRKKLIETSRRIHRFLSGRGLENMTVQIDCEPEEKCHYLRRRSTAFRGIDITANETLNGTKIDIEV